MLQRARVQTYRRIYLLGTHGAPRTVLSVLWTSLHASVRYLYIHRARQAAYSLKPGAQKFQVWDLGLRPLQFSLLPLPPGPLPRELLPAASTVSLHLHLINISVHIPQAKQVAL